MKSFWRQNEVDELFSLIEKPPTPIPEMLDRLEELFRVQQSYREICQKSNDLVDANRRKLTDRRLAPEVRATLEAEITQSLQQKDEAYKSWKRMEKLLPPPVRVADQTITSLSRQLAGLKNGSFCQRFVTGKKYQPGQKDLNELIAYITDSSARKPKRDDTLVLIAERALDHYNLRPVEAPLSNDEISDLTVLAYLYRTESPA